MARARRRTQVEGHLSIDAFLFPEPEEVRDEHVRQVRAGSVEDDRAGGVRPDPDPDQWFEALGEEAAQRVGELMMELAGPAPVGETYLEKVGRLNASKMQAEEIVRAEMLTPDPSVQQEEEDEDPESGMAETLEEMKELNRIYRDFLDESAQEEAERP